MKMKCEFFFEESKDNFRILKLSKDNKQMYIGSKYNMKIYLNNFIENIHKDSTIESVFLIYGIGSGEEIKIIRENYCKNKIIVVEPIKDLVDYLKNNKKEFEFLEDENLYIISDDDYNISDFLKGLMADYELENIVFRCLINYDKIFKERLVRFNELLKKVLIDKVIFRNTNILFAERWFETLMNNIKYIIKAIPINYYEDVFKDVPAIIVSAGPSLSKNIGRLHEVSNKMLILSGGRTLRPLIQEGIMPDVVGIVDPGEVAFNQVKGYIDKVSCPLLMYEGTNEQVVETHNNNIKKIFFTQLNDLKSIFNEDIYNLSEGGSIAHTLTSFAVKIGCNPIIFIGQDFAYTNEKYHADIAVSQFNDVKTNNIKDEEDFYVKDIHGNVVRTSKVLDNFRRYMEKIIKKHPNTTFINATEGGANIEGTVNMTLKEAIEKYKLTYNVKFNDVIDDSIINYNNVKENCVNMLCKALHSCENIQIKCEKGLYLLDDLYKYFKINSKHKVDKILCELQNIDEAITKEYKNLEILNSLLYPISLTIISQYKVEKQEDIIEKNKFLYKTILEKMDYAKKEINIALDRVGDVNYDD